MDESPLDELYEELSGEFSFGNDGRIIGGFSAAANQWPWFVTFGNFCGGSIVGSKFILTAAHCCLKFGDVSQVQMFDSTGTRFDTRIADYVVHEEFNEDNYNYDFCIVLLEDSMEYTEHRRSIGMMKQGEGLPVPGTKLYIAGRGESEQEGSRELREAEVELITYKYCNGQDVYTGFVNPASMFCAGYLKGGVDACYGDSGKTYCIF